MFLQSSSMLTPLGMNTPMVASAVKAGINCVSETAYISKSGEPIKMALVPEEAMRLSAKEIKDEFPEITARQNYLLRLIDAALNSKFVASLPADPMPVFLSGPDGLFSSYSEGLFPGFIEALCKITDITFNLADSRIFSLGRAGVLYAIEYAFRYMESTDSKQVLVGGVDCFRDQLLLAKLDSDDRVLTNGALDGFACAEGAGFLLLSKDSCRYEQSDKEIRLFPPGTDMEEGALYSNEPYLGNGLSRAVSQALQNSRHTNITKIYSSMNGEQYWAKELGVMMSRNASAFASNVDIEHPADCFGDLGAAFGSVVIACLSEQDIGKFMVYGSSDSSSRSAICVELINR